MRRSLWRKPRSQSSSSAASITLCEDPKAAVSLAMSLGLGARNLDDARPALALERSPGGEFLGRARLRHQAEGFILACVSGRWISSFSLPLSRWTISLEIPAGATIPVPDVEVTAG